MNKACSIIDNLDNALAAERSAHQLLSAELQRKNDEKKMMEARVDQLVRENEERRGPLTFATMESLREAFDVLKVAEGAEDKEVVDIYTALVRCWLSL
jgi:uncharacterized Zn finger protein